LQPKFGYLLPYLPAAVFGRCLIAALSAIYILLVPASAATGPFAEFVGSWSGNGILRPSNGAAERIRCKANYRVQGATGHDIDLQLRCASDSYNFNLDGTFTADELNRVSGQWTERSRNIGGIAIGNAYGDRLQLHVESNTFTAELEMVTRGRQQRVTINSQGGGRVIKASITLSRR
jgi:hypothetical protein